MEKGGKQMKQSYKANPVTSQQMAMMVYALNESAYRNRHLFAKTKGSPEFNKVKHATAAICVAMPGLVLNRNNYSSYIMDIVKAAYINGILVGQRLNMPPFIEAE